jgi:hypothetical protein
VWHVVSRLPFSAVDNSIKLWIQMEPPVLSSVSDMASRPSTSFYMVALVDTSSTAVGSIFILALSTRAARYSNSNKYLQVARLVDNSQFSRDVRVKSFKM